MISAIEYVKNVETNEIAETEPEIATMTAQNCEEFV